jgi:hypothetical protein
MAEYQYLLQPSWKLYSHFRLQYPRPTFRAEGRDRRMRVATVYLVPDEAISSALTTVPQQRYK